MATDNMGLTLPVVSSTPGTAWAVLLNAAMDQIDSHDHTSGKGKKVPTSGININADLPFTNNSATLLKRIGLNSNDAVLADLNSVYVSGGNLWYTNGSGNTVQITSGASVNAAAGSITGLSGSTGSASFNNGSKVFTWTGNVGVGAQMDFGAMTLYASGLFANRKVTLNAAPSMASDYFMYLPSFTPTGSGGFLMVRSSGQQEYAYPDNSTIEESSGLIKVKTITNSNITDNSINGAKLSDNTTNGAKLADTSVTASKLNLAANSISGVVLSNFTVEPAKISYTISSIGNTTGYSASPTSEYSYITLSNVSTVSGVVYRVSVQPVMYSSVVPYSTGGYRLSAANSSASIATFYVSVKVTLSTGGYRYYPFRCFVDANQTQSFPGISFNDTFPTGTHTFELVFFTTSSSVTITAQFIALVVAAP